MKLERKQWFQLPLLHNTSAPECRGSRQQQGHIILSRGLELGGSHASGGTAPHALFPSQRQDVGVLRASSQESPVHSRGAAVDDTASQVTGVTASGSQSHPGWSRENPGPTSQWERHLVSWGMEGCVVKLENRICWKVLFPLIANHPLPSHQPLPLSSMSGLKSHHHSISCVSHRPLEPHS